MFNLVDSSVFSNEFKTELKECYQYNDSQVYFLLSRRGDAVEIHIAAIGRKGKQRLREAGRAIIKQVPIMFPWCNMLIATVIPRSVYNLCLMIGFIDLGKFPFEKGDANIMVVNYELCG